MNVFLSQWLEWKRHPVTKELIQALVANRVARLEEIAHGHANGLEEIYLEIGRVQGIEDALHFLVDDVRRDILIDDLEVEDAKGSGV